MAVVLILSAISLAANAVKAEDSQASSIVSKMKAKYKSLKSIEVSGHSKSEMTPKHKLDNTDANEMKLAASMLTRTNFLIKLKRPDLYLVEWDTDSGAGSIKMRGAVYNDGTGDCLITANGMQKPENRQMALAGATGVSMGAAAALPALFFEEAWGGIPDRGFKKMQDEKIDDEDCCVLEQNLSSGKMVNTLWISKSSLLLKRYQTIITELPQRPDVNDAIMKMMANYKTIMTQTYTNTILDPNLVADQFKPSNKADPNSARAEKGK